MNLLSGNKEKNEVPVIEVKKLTKHYDGLKAVDGIDFTIYSGELTGILGPNGAGKSTTIRMLYGFTPPTSGELKVLGSDIASNAREVKSKIGVVPEENNLDVDLSLIENLELYASYFDISPQAARERAYDLMKFLHLEEKADVEIDALSHGMKRRALLARSLLNQPEILILDEPTVGLDPQGRHLLWQKLLELKDNGITQIITTHYMEEASRLCQKVFIMDSGKIIAKGNPQDLIKKYIEAEVLEISLSPVDELSLISTFNLEDKVQKLEDRILIYTEDAHRLLMKIEKSNFKTEFSMLRASNLEDVFLNLTGRKLRE